MLHNITFCVLLYKQTESMFNMKEQEKNILEKYIQGSINELEYNELKQIVITGEDKKLLEMIDTCYHKDTNIYTISSFTKETLRNEIWQQIKKANYRKRIQKFGSSSLLPYYYLYLFSQPHISIFRPINTSKSPTLLLLIMVKKRNSLCLTVQVST